jgi:hypothetical protein
MKKIIAGFIAIAFVVSVVPAPVAQAATIAELQAMIASLTAQLAALTGGSPTGAAVQFNTNLTIGSTGADVTALQQFLVSKGFLQMPVNVSYGYFGTLTRAAVAAWQAANGISPAVGYFGPISRAAIATQMTSTGGTTTVPGCGSGAVYSSTTGQLCSTGTTPTTGITTPGVEGTITATLNATPGAGTKVYEGDSSVNVLGIKLEAKTSDIRVERVKVQLPSTTFYNKIASRIYVKDGSTTIASMDLNTSTVVKEGSDYFITLSGMNFIVPKDSTRVLTIALDIYGSIDSTLTDGDTFTLTVPVDGVRGIDGAGISQYSPSTGNSFSRAFTPQGDLVDSASLQVSLSANTPRTTEVIAADGATDDELDEVTLMTFDLKADKDDVLVTDLVATLTTAGAASASTTYLYDGSTLIGSASVTTDTATFSNIDYTVPNGTTKTLTLKADIRNADATATTITSRVAAGAGGIVAENSIGDSVAESGSAIGNDLIVRNAGPQFSLVSKSITYTPSQGFAGATSTARATFNVRVRAIGGDVIFGTQAASTTFAFQTYVGGEASSLSGVASTTSFTTPSGVITSGLSAGQSFKLTENNEVTVPVDFLFEGRTAAGALIATNSYAVGLENIKWSINGNDTQTTSFMTGETDWRTSTITMP